MLLPALGKARERARAANCMSNLKQVGIAQLLYADDNQGQILLYMNGTTPKARWTQYWADWLYDFDYMPDGSKFFQCPSLPCEIYDATHTGCMTGTYGVYICSNSNDAFVPFSLSILCGRDTRNPVTLAIHKMQTPSSVIAAADSVVANVKRQSYKIDPGCQEEVHMRHNGRANIAFADGHVASRSAKELKDGLMWVHSGVDGNGVYVKF